MSTKTNLALDITIFAAFLVISNPRFTGNSIHEWLGVSFTAALIAHLLFHWKWIISVSTEYFKKFFHRSRLNYIVDLLFFIAMTGAMFSGLMISKDVLSTFGVQLGNISRSWKSIHSMTADASLLLLGLHFALHWKWVVTNVGRYIVSPVANLFRGNQAPQPQPKSLAIQPVRIEERK